MGLKKGHFSRFQGSAFLPALLATRSEGSSDLQSEIDNHLEIAAQNKLMPRADRQYRRADQWLNLAPVSRIV